MIADETVIHHFNNDHWNFIEKYNNKTNYKNLWNSDLTHEIGTEYNHLNKTKEYDLNLPRKSTRFFCKLVQSKSNWYM